MPQVFTSIRSIQKPLPRRSSWMIAASTAIGFTILASDATFAATPQAGKSPVKISDKDWVIQIVPGPAIGPSPVPAFNANARKAAAKLAAKAQQAIEAADAVQPPDEVVPPKQKAIPGKQTSVVEPAAEEAQTAESQPLPVIIPAIPDPDGSASPVVPANCEQAGPRSISPAAYAEVYQSIPFSRAEYFANPAYRHEATMEILFGQLRPKTVMQLSVPMTQTTHGFAIPFRSHSTIQQDIRHRYPTPPYYYFPYAQ